jgi:hypothetical protein
MRCASLPGLAAAGLAATAALALVPAVRAEDAVDPVDGAIRLEVGVGETVSRDVGIAIGLRCDDLTPIRVALRTVAADANRFEVTGVAEGATRCRVGVSSDRPTFLFEIHVAPLRPGAHR